ncbi:alanine--tRNA ligase-related protein [Kitasatospora sp. NPDC056446]|uniref:alanine--tRNA ligase-related protein n=1 Tax=Kitasatospora sp. NPDC056446 TaxID=3345819 RepID=UPI00368C3658
MSGGEAIWVGQALIDGLARRGYRRAVPQALTPPRREGGLFTGPAGPDWPKHLLAAAARPGAGAATLAWCFDTGRLDALPAAAPPSAQRVVGAVHVGRQSCASLLDDVLTALKDCGVDRSALVAGVTAAPATATDSAVLLAGLAAAGVPERTRIDRLPPGAARRLWPERGPCFTLESPVGPKCSEYCAPGCFCGRYVLLGYGQFLGRSLLPDGRTGAPPHRAAFEVVLPEYAVGCVRGGVRTPLELPAFRPLLDGIGRTFPELSEGPRGAEAARTIADHLCAAALLLGSGIAPGPRGTSYVVRRLLRRAANEAFLAGARPDGLVAATVLADAAVRTPLGLDPLPTRSLALVRRETTAFQAVLEAGRRWFLRLAAGTRPDDLPHLLWRARRERGVPIAVLLGWCEELLLPVSVARLAALAPPLAERRSPEEDSHRRAVKSARSRAS